MELFTLINTVGVFLLGIVFASLVLIIIFSDTGLEWKITRTLLTIFAALSVWAVIRYINRLDKLNFFDVLIIAFNLGLFGVGYYTSRNIKK